MTNPDVLVEGLRCAPGTPFFRWLVTTLRDTLEVRYAFIGEFTGDDGTRCNVLATTEDPESLDHTPYAFDVDGTPAAEPTDADGFHWHPRDVRARFPHVQIYRALGIESIACLRLGDGHGRPLGVLCVLDTRPFADPEQIRRVMLGLKARTSGDLELRRVQSEQQMLTEATAVARSADALPHIVEQLARALDVRCAFVSEIVDDPPTRARTLAMWDRGRLVPNFEYALADTPCALVYERDVVLHPRNLQQIYPRDRYLAETGAQAYLGVALHDRQGRAIGHVGVLHDRPLHEGLAGFPLFHVLALLASKELERRRTPAPAAGHDELAAGEVAHDFNNLLTGILAHSGLALDEIAAPDEVRARLQAIQSTAHRAADLARDMLDGHAAERVPVEAVDLGALVRETAALLAPAFPAHVGVEVEAADALPPVLGRPTQLRQIVMNLLLNASEAIGPEPGHVRVRVARDPAPARPDTPGRVVLTVADTGVGMTPTLQARIFEPRFTTKSGGRGVGLAIVRKLVDAHHATVDVESAPAAGTRFTLGFPVAPSAAAPAPDSGSRGPSRPLERAVRALLVDDDEGVRLTTTHMLRRLGCEVTSAADGAAALALLERDETPPHLVLLDMAMPGMSGEELAGAIRRRWPVLPIVVMSGYVTQDLTRRLGQQPALHFLQKPFGLDALRACLAGLEPAMPHAPERPRRARA